ncbi:MAG TPA: gamma carbonic anhydrase family protein [Actinomadura sp.]|jgi:carbonic anhydrase/acetyltransferase-like protein (isoleucine patch superfamily)|nr:gamma carbonic anhydrase family protein [Actinomadura sp.]
MSQPLVLSFDGFQPVIAPTAWLAPNATVAGRATVGAGSSVWYTAVVRADLDSVSIGNESNVQDGAVLHTDPGFPLTVGDRVSIGHRAILHGCTIEDDVLVGMGAVIMNGAVVGEGSLIAAGAVVLEGTRIPPGSLVAGLPGKVRRELTDAEREGTRLNAAVYRDLATRHAAATGEGQGQAPVHE